MTTWKTVQLEKVGEIITGSTPSTKVSEYWNGDIQFVSPSDFADSRYVIETERKITSEGARQCRAIPKDAVMVTCIGSIGGVAMSSQSCITNQQINSIVCNGNYDATFIYYSILNNISKLIRLAGATTLPIVNKSSFASIELLTPNSKAEQTRIAAVLSRIDRAIEHTEALIAKQQRIKTGLMQDLLTKGIDEHGNIRSEATHEFKDSPLGRIPKEWNVDRVGNAYEVHNHLRKPISAQQREQMRGIYPYYGPTGILDYLNEHRVDGEFVLIGEDGDHFLKFTTWQMTQLVRGKFNVNNHAHILKGTHNCLTQWFHQFFCHRDITFHLTRQGAGRFKLNKATLLQLQLALPLIEEQRRIISFLNTFSLNAQHEKDFLSKLQKTKQGLMQDLLTGKVSVESLLAE